MTLSQEWLDHFVREEGYRRKAYKDHLGNWTIGVGHLLGTSPKFATYVWDDETILKTLEINVDTAVAAAKEIFPQYDIFSPGLQLAMADMLFNLGEARFRKFKQTIRFINESRFVEAAEGALQSLWATQVPNRAKRVTDLIRAGYIVSEPAAEPFVASTAMQDHDCTDRT